MSQNARSSSGSALLAEVKDLKVPKYKCFYKLVFVCGYLQFCAHLQYCNKAYYVTRKQTEKAYVLLMLELHENWDSERWTPDEKIEILRKQFVKLGSDGWSALEEYWMEKALIHDQPMERANQELSTMSGAEFADRFILETEAETEERKQKEQELLALEKQQQDLFAAASRKWQEQLAKESNDKEQSALDGN